MIDLPNDLDYLVDLDGQQSVDCQAVKEKPLTEKEYLDWTKDVIKRINILQDNIRKGI
jgi:hypothetical protein